MGSRMSSVAVLLDCKIRNAQKILTEEGLQSKGSSHMDTHISDDEEMAAPVGRLLGQEDKNGQAQRTRHSAMPASQGKCGTCTAGPLGTRRAEISGSSPKPVLPSYSRHPR